jgi:hypothetical protein
MKMRRLFSIPDGFTVFQRLLWTSAIAAAMQSTAIAQSKTGTSIAQFSLIDPSARSAAMGGTGVTSTSEALSSFYNPGALGAMQRSDVQFTYNLWFAGITVSNAIAAIRIGEAGTGAVAVTSVYSGDIDVRTVEQPLGTGERYSVNDLLIGLGYGIAITDRFFCGLQVNYVSETIWHSSTHLFGVNFGTLYELSADGLRIGASLSNFGTKNHYSGTDTRIRYDLDPSRYGDNSNIPAELVAEDFSMPIVFRVGLGYPLHIDDANIVNLGMDAQHSSDNSECVNLGAEYAFKSILYLRAGYANLFQTDSEVGLTAGAGVAWDGFGSEVRFDYGWGSHKHLGAVHRITVAVGF